ncbi:response regulator transcription factor [Dactylosporangium sp. CA-092794]|uniref:response regulator transcription factor n=1 Tax=Dactylosporangium sp. CA-092794 TaxID=3239929 RepID=UPI003D8AEF97
MSIDASVDPRCHGERHYAVAIVDDHPASRTGLEKVVSDARDLTVAASAGTVADLDPAVPFDVVLLDVPQFRSGGLVHDVELLTGRAGVVVTSTWGQPPTIGAMVRAGARGYLTRRSDVAVITTALAAVAAGSLFVCPELVGRFNTELTRGAVEDSTELSPREVETLRWIAMGLTHAQIARRMGLTEATVNTYTKRIRAKLNAGNKAELTRIAIELGHVNPGDHRFPAA